MSAVTTAVAHDPQLPAEAQPAGRLLTAAAYHRLSDVPPEVEWFANLTSPQTREDTGTQYLIDSGGPTAEGSVHGSAGARGDGGGVAHHVTQRGNRRGHDQGR